MGNRLKIKPQFKSFKKYFQVFKMSWQNTFVYRLSFVIHRLGNLVLFLATFLFWYAVYQTNSNIAGYDEKTMLTYIIGIGIIRGLVFSSRSNQVAPDIATGALSKYLVKPIKYFGWQIFLDLGDKASDLLFLMPELGLIFVILKPPFFIQTNPFYLFTFLPIILLSVFIYFYISLLINLSTFWYPEHNGWPARFLFDVLLVFFTGGLLPLDILPKPVFNFLMVLPTAYLRFFPMQVYLGRVNLLIIFLGVLYMIFWLVLLRFLVKLIWQKGLKNYTAAGI